MKMEERKLPSPPHPWMVHLHCSPHAPFPPLPSGSCPQPSPHKLGCGRAADRRGKTLSTLLSCCATPKSQPPPPALTARSPSPPASLLLKRPRAHWRGRRAAGGRARRVCRQVWDEGRRREGPRREERVPLPVPSAGSPAAHA